MKKYLLPIVLLLVFLQSAAIYSVYKKAYNPSNKNVFNCLEKQLLLNQKQLSSSAEEILLAFYKRVDKEKRGFKYLDIAKCTAERNESFLLLIDSLGSIKNKHYVNLLISKIKNNFQQLRATLSQEEEPFFYEERLIPENNFIKEIKLLEQLPNNVENVLLQNLKTKNIYNTKQVIDEAFDKSGTITLCCFGCGPYPTITINKLRFLKGDILNAKIYITDYESRKEVSPKIQIAGHRFKLDKDGVGTYQTTPTKLGAYSVNGTISFKTPEDALIVRPFSSSYFVVPPCN